jgi:DNA polymerase-3 subunit delta
MAGAAARRTGSEPIHLIRGDDAVLVGDAVRAIVDEAVGGGDHTLMVTELDASAYEDDQGSISIGPLVDAAQTPPFLTERRVVVGRHASVFSTAESVEPLVRYLSDPLPTTVLVLAWEKGPKAGARVAAIPRKLSDAITASGGVVVDTRPGTGRSRTQWLDERLADVALRLDAGAKARLYDHLGEEVSRVGILLDTLVSAFGEGARLGADDIEPFLGDAGDVAPWELTDAIDRGDTQTALSVLDRMLGAGRHPLQIGASLHSHYQRMLRLDGADVGSEAAAAELLGMKGSTFPARKAHDQSRKLGPDRLHELVGLVAEADLDLRGAKAWPPELVVEVLVARLASRTPRTATTRR